MGSVIDALARESVFFELGVDGSPLAKEVVPAEGFCLEFELVLGGFELDFFVGQGDLQAGGLAVPDEVGDGGAGEEGAGEQ